MLQWPLIPRALSPPSTAQGASLVFTLMVWSQGRLGVARSMVIWVKKKKVNENKIDYV